MTTQEKNELMAVFHGWTKFKVGKGTGITWWTFTEFGRANWKSDSFRYHSDASWLFPVWHKFREFQLEMSVSIHNLSYSQHRKQILAAFENGTFGDLYDSLVNAVQWYNSIQQKYEAEKS